LADLAANSVDSSKVVDGSIVLADLAAREAVESLAPEFQNFTLQADGSNNKGTLESDHDSTNDRNFYRWTSRKGALHDYDIILQWAVPENFQAWSATNNPIEADFRTDTTLVADNVIDFTMEDTAGAAVSLSAGTGKVSTVAATWVDDNVITNSIVGGTFTPGDFVTIRIKMSSRSSNATDLGALRFSYTVK
jgi:hypothetical protein